MIRSYALVCYTIPIVYHSFSKSVCPKKSEIRPRISVNFQKRSASRLTPFSDCSCRAWRRKPAVGLFPALPVHVASPACRGFYGENAFLISNSPQQFSPALSIPHRARPLPQKTVSYPDSKRSFHPRRSWHGRWRRSYPGQWRT